jgi:uncharacterized protein
VTARLFVDTSAWFAFANRRDADHRAVAVLLRTPGLRLVTSNYVFDETITLCRRRLGHDVASRVGHALLAGEVDLLQVTPGDQQVAWRLFLERADQEYSLTDCTSFVLMRRLRLDTAAALDDDFVREGFEAKP